jgi:hypothetical protein
MNPRIKELAQQALQLVADEHTKGDKSRLNTDSYLVRDLIHEKFAELIVRECAKFTFKYTSDEKNIQEYNQVGWDFLSGDLRNAIEEHFGVNK